MSAAEDLAENFKQWTISADRPAGPVLPKPSFGGPADRSYNLKNRFPRKLLQYEEQRVGINLGWTDDAEPATVRRVTRWFFARAGGDGGPIRYGETIALAYGGGASFIRYAERPVGINLDWSESPVFEWKILGGGTGEPVQSGEWVALLNLKPEGSAGGDCLVYFDRPAGGDIGWTTSKPLLGDVWDKLEQQAWKAAREAAVKLLSGGGG